MTREEIERIQGRDWKVGSEGPVVELTPSERDALCEAALRTFGGTFLAFDIGCIECGERSAVIGLFRSREDAETACKAAESEQEKNWHGQHSFEVFEITDIIRETAQQCAEIAASLRVIINGTRDNSALGEWIAEIIRAKFGLEKPKD